MANPLGADRILKALRDEGVKVVEYKSWRTHNRNHKGTWGPVHGVMIHHTVTTGTQSTVDLCYDGRSDLPGPLCHGVIAKDGTCYLVGHGRANHAGSGDGDVLAAVIAERDLPADNETDTDGNARFYGFECVNLGDGKDPWPPVQVEAIVRASAALCRAHGWGKDGSTSVIGHLEWQPGKVDPRPSPGGADVRMGTIRARVAERLRHPASWSPSGAGTTTPEEDEDMPSAEEIAHEVWAYKYEHGGKTITARTRLGRAYENALGAKLAAQEATAKLAANESVLSAIRQAVAEGGGLTEAQATAAAEAGARAALEQLGERLTDDEG